MLDKILKISNQADRELTFEIGSNSDLILENTITQNLEWTIPIFAKKGKGFLTFPTKFDMVQPILNLDHKGKTIVRVSLNPDEVIQKVEFGTSRLENRVKAINKLKDAGYKVGILIAPIVLINNWKQNYKNLIEYLNENLSYQVKKDAFFEIIFMTYSYIHRKINEEAFPNAIDLYNKEIMTSRGKGKYTYNNEIREEGKKFIIENLNKYFPKNKIMYIV